MRARVWRRWRRRTVIGYTKVKVGAKTSKEGDKRGLKRGNGGGGRLKKARRKKKLTGGVGLSARGKREEEGVDGRMNATRRKRNQGHRIKTKG